MARSYRHIQEYEKEILLFPQLTLEFIKQHIVSAEHEKSKRQINDVFLKKEI